MLKVEGLNVYYGETQVLWDISLELREREIVCIVGANGAGKTTLLKTISGLIRARSGRIQFGEWVTNSMAAYEIVKLGMIQIPEGRKLFPSMSVLENLELGGLCSSVRKGQLGSLPWVFQLSPILEARKNQLAGTLSGGEQQMVAIGRGLMGDPKLLILDEPSLGLAPLVVREIFQVMRQVNEKGTALFLSEQNLFDSLKLSHRGYVLEVGRITLEGKSSDLLVNEHTKKAYLGM